MNYKLDTINSKPKDWPANAIECQLENIQNQMDEFKRNPNYKNKEVLVSLVTDYDLNQRSALGLLRTTKYEVAIINSLFFDASIIQLNALKVYLYELITQKTQMQKIILCIPDAKQELDIKEF